MRGALAYPLTAALLIAAVAILLGWKWGRIAGRIASWFAVAIYAMLIVPDWDDAVLTDQQALNWGCAWIAVYYLLCAIVLGFGAKGRNRASVET
jgi:hypothetical protein